MTADEETEHIEHHYRPLSELADRPDYVVQLATDHLLGKTAAPIAFLGSSGEEADIMGIFEKSLHLDKKEDSARICILCGATFAGMPGVVSHYKHAHPWFVTIVQEYVDMGANPGTARAGASNRQVIKRMELWGWQRSGKHEADYIEMVLPGINGEDNRVMVIKEEVSAHNKPSTMLAIYHMTGISPDDFWDRTPAPVVALVPSDETLEKTNRMPTSKPCLDLLLGQDRPLTVEWMAETLGLTPDQVSKAMYYMIQQGLVKRVLNGMYQAVEHRYVQEDQDVRVDVDTQNVPRGPQIAPEAPPVPIPAPDPAPTVHPAVVDVLAPSEQEIYEVLDLLVPQGFKARHYPAVHEWVQATRRLVAALREG